MQEAQQAPGLYRACSSAHPYGPDAERRVKGVGDRLDRQFAFLEPVDIDTADGATRGGNGIARRRTTSPLRKPTPRQQALWNAVQQVKLRGHFR